MRPDRHVRPVVLLLLAVPAAAQSTTRIDVSTSGTEASQGAQVPIVSADGRFVVFASYSEDLVAGDTNATGDAFLRDRVDGTTERVSLPSAGGQGNLSSFAGAVTPDGRYVLFGSFATNMVPGDTNAAGDLFVRDRVLDTTTRVSLDSFGNEGNDDSTDWMSISDDGRYVCFSSTATNLVAGDTNGAYDIFVRDRQAGTTERVSVDSGEAQANGNSNYSFMSRDGRFVVFKSVATNLVAGDTNAKEDVFLRDRQTGLTERVSVGAGGVQGDGDSTNRPSVSADGRFVEFASASTNLVAGDTNGLYDIFVRDRQTGTTERASVATGGAQANNASFFAMISSDGQYVAVNSFASNLVAGDTNASEDVFLRDRAAGTTERISVDSSGAQGNFGSDYASVSSDGRLVAFASGASNLVSGDTNMAGDVFLRDRVLPEPLVAFCYPGQGGIRTCPCGNPPGSGIVGCNNFGPSPAGGTGGARLAATGTPSLGSDTIQFQVTAQQSIASNITVLFQGTTTRAAGAQSGAGVRCVAGTLKRLYKGNASAGSISFPTGAQPDVHTASANVGFPIVAPVTLYYYAAYRNSAAGAPCGSATLGFNATNAGALRWVP